MSAEGSMEREAHVLHMFAAYLDYYSKYVPTLE